MTRIIGHRGAAGLALENTIESFKKAFEIGVDTVELDVHVTKDGQFVVSHDPNLKRISGTWASISSLTYDELARIKLHNGETVPLLETVLELVKTERKRVIVEMKVNRHLDDFISLIAHYDGYIQAVAANNFRLLQKIRALRPKQKLYVIERFNPFSALQKARAIRATGIDMNFWLLNPLTYWLARRYKLELIVYTVNWQFINAFLQKLYPKARICTNVPHKFLKTAEAIEYRTGVSYKRQRRRKT